MFKNNLFLSMFACLILAGCAADGASTAAADTAKAEPTASAEPARQTASETKADAEKPRAAMIGLVPGETAAPILLRMLGKPDAEVQPQEGRVLAQYRTNRIAIIRGYQEGVPMLVVLSPDDPRLSEMPEKVLTLDFMQRPNGWVMTGYKLD